MLKELEDEAGNERSTLNRKGAPRKEELVGIIKNVETALKELEDLVTRYASLGERRNEHGTESDSPARTWRRSEAS